MCVSSKELRSPGPRSDAYVTKDMFSMQPSNSV